MRVLRYSLTALTIIVVIFALSLLAAPVARPEPVEGRPSTGSGRSTLTLRAPDFVRVASAETTALGTRLDQEAGMAAWFKAADPISLPQDRSAFRTIETETSDYIIGSVAVPGYSENEDAHVYAHKDGWILAYYPNTEWASKIIHVNG